MLIYQLLLPVYRVVAAMAQLLVYPNATHLWSALREKPDAHNTPARLEGAMAPLAAKYDIYDKIIKLLPDCVRDMDHTEFDAEYVAEDPLVGAEMADELKSFNPGAAVFSGGKELCQLFTFYKNQRQALINRLDSSGHSAEVLKYLTPPPPLPVAALQHFSICS